MSLAAVADEIQHRLIHIFGRDPEGRRATNGGNTKLNRDPHFRDYVLFHEFFHGNDGRGLGASHQTGWTGLVAWNIMQRLVAGSVCSEPCTDMLFLNTAVNHAVCPARRGVSCWPHLPQPPALTRLSTSSPPFLRQALL